MMYIYTVILFFFALYSLAMDMETESTITMGLTLLGMGVGAIMEIYQMVVFTVQFLKSAARKSEIPLLKNGLFLPCSWSWCLIYLGTQEELLNKIMDSEGDKTAFIVVTAILLHFIGALFEVQIGLLSFYSNILAIAQRKSKVEVDTEAQKK